MGSQHKQANFPMQTKAIPLQMHEPFSMGGNRLCFVHPDDPDCCLKVYQPRGRPEERRQRKGWIGYLRPLSTYDENLQEHRALTQLHEALDAVVTQHLPRSKGLAQTDLGEAHAMQLIRDHDGKISQTLEQYIWERGIDSTAQEALHEFGSHWIQGAPTTRDLLPHNLLMQRFPDSARLILVDGFGRPRMSRFRHLLGSKAQTKHLKRLDQRLEEVMLRKNRGDSPKKRIGQLQR